MTRADHPTYRDPDCPACDPFNGLPGYPLAAHTCRMHAPSPPPDRARRVGEDPDDYSLRHEMRNG